MCVGSNPTHVSTNSTVYPDVVHCVHFTPRVYYGHCMRCKSDFLGRLCAYEPDALVRFGVGRRVGSGRSGTVYESARGCVIKVASAGIEFWDEIDGILSYLKDVKNPSVMDVKEYHFIGSDASDVLYCLISERLHPIDNDDEGEFACAVVDDVWNPENVPDETRADPRWHSRPFEELRKNLKVLPYVHKDIHWGNIMKDCFGNYKLIDVEAFNVT